VKRSDEEEALVFEVTCEVGFCATHRLLRDGAPIEPLHGHDWRVEAVAAGDTLDGSGLLLDFAELQRALSEVVGALHHGDLNALSPFAGLSPSAEVVARHIFVEVRRRLGRDGSALSRVRVFEAPGCSATYAEG
jgi:6-pyruvoyltetrahydropterin/6-carboxytetrahydropterin synthase